MSCSSMCYDLFKNHVVINMGQSPKSEFYNNDGIGMPFLQGNRTFGFKYPYYDTYCSDIKKIAEKGDVLFSVRAPVGDVNITTERVCIGRGLASLRMKNGNQEYLYYLLKANRKYIENRENGTVFGSINKKGLEELEFYFPSDEVQNKISKVLTILDNKIQLNNEMNKTLEEMAQALFKRWFVDFEFPSVDGKPYKSSGGEMIESEMGMIPKGWKVKKIEEMCDVKGGKRLPKGKSVLDHKTEYPYIRVTDVTKGYVDVSNIKYIDEETRKPIQKYIINYEDVYISIAGTVGLVGTIVKELDKASLTENMARIITTNVNKYLLKLYMNSEEGIEYIKANTVGSTQPKLPLYAIKGMPIVMAPKIIESKFSNIINALYLKIEMNLEQSRCLTQLRDSLLPKLMSGEIRVNDRKANL